ncbi:MAG: GNAT family N-acetyltransferase [Vicinamibacterales bacterium]
MTSEIFERLADAILREEGDAEAARERLWRLPELCARYAFGPAASRDEAWLVDALQHRAAELAEVLLDRSASRRRLARRLSAAASRSVLRPWRPDDAPTLAALLDDTRVWSFLPEAQPNRIDAAMAGQLISIANGAPDRHLVRAIDTAAGVAGQVRLQFDATPFADAAEISYWLGPAYWGLGIATDAVVRLTADAFAQRPSLQRIVARVAHGHEASVRVLRKAGFWPETVSCGDMIKDGRHVGRQQLSVWRFDYAGLGDGSVSGRGTPAYPTAGMLALHLDHLAEAAASMAALL